MITVFLIGSFLLGTAVGSFLNVVILRFGREGITGRSHCPHCGRILAWHELIPLVSFFLQRGRCLSCNHKLSWQYPAVELLTGILFFSFAIRLLLFFPQGPQAGFFFTHDGWWIWPLLAAWWYFGAILVIVAVYDLQHSLIPDRFVLPALLVAFLSKSFGQFLGHVSAPLFPSGGPEFLGPGAFIFGRVEGASLLFSLIGLVAATAALGSLWFFSRGNAMGFGDVKLGFFLGFVLGWPDILLALFLAFLSGTFASLVLIALKRRTIKSHIPFGPFLVLGTVLTVLFGDTMLNAYLRILPHFFL